MNCIIHMNGYHIHMNGYHISQKHLLSTKNLSQQSQIEVTLAEKGDVLYSQWMMLLLILLNTPAPRALFSLVSYTGPSNILFKFLTQAFCLETSLTGLQELPLSPGSSWIRPLNFHIKIIRISLFTRKDFRDLAMEQLKNSRNFLLYKKEGALFKAIFPQAQHRIQKKYKEGIKNQNTEGGREWK